MLRSVSEANPYVLLELPVPLAHHHFAVLAALVHRRIDDQEFAPRTQAAADLGQRAPVVRRVVDGRVVDRQIEAAGGQRQIVELRVDARKRRAP